MTPGLPPLLKNATTYHLHPAMKPLAKDIPGEEETATGTGPGNLLQRRTQTTPGTSLDHDSRLGTVAPAAATVSVPAEQAVPHGVQSARVAPPNGVYSQISEALRLQVAHARALGHYARPRPSEPVSGNPAVCRLPATPLNRIPNTAAASTQDDAYNRLSLYMQQQLAQQATVGTRNSVSVTGGGAQGMVHADDKMANAIERARYATGGVLPSNHIPSASTTARTPMHQQYLYTHKRAAPYQEQAHQIGNSLKYQRTTSPTLNFNTGPSCSRDMLVNLVDNAAAYFEGKTRPEDATDMRHSRERYDFNGDMLSEIFEGPRPNSDPADAMEERNFTQREKAVRDNLLRRLGENMISRTHDDRMAEFEEMCATFRDIDNGESTDKGSMKILQRLERAKKTDELQKIREEYEEENCVRFVEAPDLIVKKELDPSIAPLSSHSNSRILRFP